MDDLLLTLRTADYGTAAAIDAVDEWLWCRYPLGPLDAALDELERRAWGELARDTSKRGFRGDVLPCLREAAECQRMESQ